MDDEQEDGARAPRWDGEDVTPTSKREVRGWYSMGLAAEIFAVCGVGSFAPVTLEQLAREAGTLKSDPNSPCIVRPSANVARQLLVRTLVPREDNATDQCVIHPFGMEVSTPSFAMFTFSIAVFVQALALISFSGVADFGTYRKRLMLGFAFTGAASTMMMVLVWPQTYLLGSLLTIIGVVCLGSTFVLLNSFLPLLASNHPAASEIDGYERLMQQTSSKASITSPELRLSTQISAKGVGFGYAAAVSIQILSILLLVLLKKASFRSESVPLRFVLLMVGIFWLLLTLPGALWLRDRPGPALTTVVYRRSRIALIMHYIAFAWSSVWTTVKTALRLRQTRVFLIAWFLLSDSIATVSGTAILFARTELHMGTIPIALLSITATMSGIAGALCWPQISKYFGLQAKDTIMACIVMMEIIPLYGLLGFIPFVRAWGVIGLQQSWEIYPLAVVHGFVMGGLSSYCRSLYGEIICPGSEAAFYALYAITDKGSSAVGPAIVGIIVDRVGTIRPAFGFLALLIVLPLPLIYTVDVNQGREDAFALSKHAGFTAGQGIVMEDYIRVSLSDESESGSRQSVSETGRPHLDTQT